MTKQSISTWDSFKLKDQIHPGNNVTESLSISDCKVMRLNDKSGHGLMTIYQVFDGVFLMYNDFHLRECVSEFQSVETLFAIDHCLEGAMEQQLSTGRVVNIRPGNLKLDTRVHHQGKNIFPNCHFHGITIGFDSLDAQKSIDRFSPDIHVDLRQLAEKFCPENLPVVYGRDDFVEALFYPLYHLSGNINLEYLRVKIMEILVFLKSWEVPKVREEDSYIYADQAARIRGIHEYLIHNLDISCDQKELADRFGINETAMKKGFKTMYGDSIHAYLKAYRIQQSALLLSSRPDLSISEVGQKVGYGSHSKFTAAFKKQFGKTPQEYRSQELSNK